ncbi:MAG TPA: phosphatidate cytidylyltransferase [Planctomycetota bacterium]|nr:phosphatidate cytidylyltransferase [Planctomycetota bacterium]
MKTRILVGAALIAAVAGIYLLDARVLGNTLLSRAVLWVLALLTLHEVLALGARRIETGPGLFLLAGIAVTAVVAPYLVLSYDVPIPVPGTLLVLAAIVAAGVRLLGMAPLRSAPTAFPEAMLLGAGILAIAGLVCFLDRILVRPRGLHCAIAVIAIAKTADMSGYFVGTLVGRRRIAPAISPKKTWEGTIGSILGAAGVGALLAPELNSFPSHYGAAAGALLGGAAFLGGILASGLKRWAGVKDSSVLLPEFGGFLDLLDSILVAAPVAVAFLHGV